MPEDQERLKKIAALAKAGGQRAPELDAFRAPGPAGDATATADGTIIDVAAVTRWREPRDKLSRLLGDAPVPHDVNEVLRGKPTDVLERLIRGYLTGGDADAKLDDIRRQSVSYDDGMRRFLVKRVMVDGFPEAGRRFVDSPAKELIHERLLHMLIRELADAGLLTQDQSEGIIRGVDAATAEYNAADPTTRKYERPSELRFSAGLSAARGALENFRACWDRMSEVFSRCVGYVGDLDGYLRANDAVVIPVRVEDVAFQEKYKKRSAEITENVKQYFRDRYTPAEVPAVSAPVAAVVVAALPPPAAQPQPVVHDPVAPPAPAAPQQQVPAQQPPQPAAVPAFAAVPPAAQPVVPALTPAVAAAPAEPTFIDGGPTVDVICDRLKVVRNKEELITQLSNIYKFGNPPQIRAEFLKDLIGSWFHISNHYIEGHVATRTCEMIYGAVTAPLDQQDEKFYDVYKIIMDMGKHQTQNLDSWPFATRSKDAGKLCRDACGAIGKMFPGFAARYAADERERDAGDRVIDVDALALCHTK